jgi:hypothetical protein
VTKQTERTRSRAGSTAKPTSARLLPNRPADPEEPAAGKTIDEVESQVKTPELLADPVDAVKPSPVQNNRLHATYVGLGLERDKDEEKLVHLDFSFTLEKEHETGHHLPEKVKHAWHYLQESGDKAVQVQGIPAVTLDVYAEPKEKRQLLHLVGAAFSKAVVSIIEEVGKGKAVKKTRFAFRLLVERTPEVMEFAAWNDGEQFWISMPATQKSMVAGA